MSAIDQAAASMVVVTTDGRPAEQYGAVLVFTGRRPWGWIPTRTVTADEVDDLIAATNTELAERGVAIRRVTGVDAVEYASGDTVALVAAPTDDDMPVGAVEIAARLGVARATVDSWRIRDSGFPDPDWTVGGRPAWRWSAVRDWAAATGRATP